MKSISEMHERVDAINSKLVAETARLGKPITCKGKGCFACCYEPVYCSSDEVHHMLEEVSVIDMFKLSERVALELAKVNESGLFNKDMPPVMEWKAMNLPCPFLVDGQCSVYERRPVSCRSHMAVGPAEWCETKRLEQKYPGSQEVSAACGTAIIEAHMKLGNTIIFDNLLALLENELLGEYHATASAQQIVFTTNKDSNETKR